MGPAARLIQALSPYCSESLFKELEQALIHYHDPDEKRVAEYYLKAWKTRYFGYYWGKAQFFY
jgi:hypothetical protein